MVGCRRVATVAEHPAGHVVKAGKPPGAPLTGNAAPLSSVARRVLNGLKAAPLFVEPPSAVCHSSRLATFWAVSGAPTPCRTHCSHPTGSAVPGPAAVPGAAAAGVGWDAAGAPAATGAFRPGPATTEITAATPTRAR